ncbi:MAG: hypothetical protein L3J83_04150 [Proteobacteria bacterium]|nr:hypothetical protein [Pseudomonadota bacterium]
MRLIVQVIDAHRKVIKTVATLLVMRLFMGFLGASRTCANTVFSMSGFGLYIITTVLIFKGSGEKAGGINNENRVSY